MLLFVICVMSVFCGCGDYNAGEHYDPSYGRKMRQIDAEMYNIEQVNNATGKSVIVPLF